MITCHDDFNHMNSENLIRWLDGFDDRTDPNDFNCLMMITLIMIIMILLMMRWEDGDAGGRVWD